MVPVDKYFSVLALFILFRETIEASIICGVLLQFLNRAKPGLKRAVWYGVAAGVAVSIVFGIIFIAVYYTAKNNLFQGKNRDWFKGVISWVAALLITILGFAMLRFLGWEEKWKRRLTAAVAKKVPDVVAPAADTTPASDDPSTTTTTLATTTTTITTTAAVAPKDAGSSPAPAPASTSTFDSNNPLIPAATTPTPTTHKPALPASSSSCSSSATSLAQVIAKDPEAAIPAPTTAAAITAQPDDPTSMIVANADGELCDLSPPTRREMLNIFVLVFTTVLREGIESVVFLGGLSNVKVTAIPLPAFVGITAGCLVGIFLYFSGKQVKHIKWLIIGMAVVIFFIAAGQVNIGTDSLMRAGLFGYCSPWLDERPWYMVPMYDWSGCCADTDPTGTEPTNVQNRKRFFALARAIFGYQDKGTPVEVMSYACYWGLVFILAGLKAWQGTLFDADFKYKREQRKLAKEAKRREAEAAAAEAAKVEALEAGEGGMREEEGAEGIEAGQDG
ncbi:hypothetical protein Agub_g1111, partial [Astrephomene gubernaculifera]